jgi:hypothetical protein
MLSVRTVRAWTAKSQSRSAIPQIAAFFSRQAPPPRHGCDGALDIVK